MVVRYMYNGTRDYMVVRYMYNGTRDYMVVRYTHTQIRNSENAECKYFLNVTLTDSTKSVKHTHGDYLCWFFHMPRDSHPRGPKGKAGHLAAFQGPHTTRVVITNTGNEVTFVRMETHLVHIVSVFSQNLQHQDMLHLNMTPHNII